jgi:pimeloyl-ACP methyl ester carboxylesterase
MSVSLTLPTSHLTHVKQHRFSFGDCLVAVTERSNGAVLYPALFFLHGRYGDGEVWWPIIDRLFPRFRCFSVDLPGFGHSFSARERGLSLLEHSQIVHHLVDRFVSKDERAVLVGHDLGGAIAQVCALEMSNKVSGIVLINCSGLSEPVRGMKTGLFGWAMRWRLRKLLSHSCLARDSALFHSLLWDPWRNSQTRSALVRAMRAFEVSWPGPFERQYWREELRKSQIPVLLLWGTQDPINDTEIALKMMRELPEAYLFENEIAGHWPLLEDPDWVSDKILEFTFRLAGPSSAFPSTTARRAAG